MFGNPAYPIQLPCGQCIGCRLEYSRQWAVRCYHESKMYEDNAFTTLTYNNEKLPNDPLLGQPSTGTLVPEHLKNFLKRLRKTVGSGVRFYACGEYGPENMRPHYHVCFFNYKPDDLVLHNIRDENRYYTSDFLESKWGNGFTLTGEVNFQSAAYVARYIIKKRTGKGSDDQYETVDPSTGQIFTRHKEFTRQSNGGGKSKLGGIGKLYLETYQSDIYDHDHVIINSKKTRPPRYYDKQYEITNPDDLASLKLARERNAQRHRDNNTPERLAVRETIQETRLRQLPRVL